MSEKIVKVTLQGCHDRNTAELQVNENGHVLLETLVLKFRDNCTDECMPLMSVEVIQDPALTIMEKALKEDMEKARQRYYGLINNCPHRIGKRGESAYCMICQKDMGWWCPSSPKNTCDYLQADNSVDEDHCRYCGQPEERK